MLIKLYQATAASTVDAIDAFSSITSGWYLPRYDAVWYAGSTRSVRFDLTVSYVEKKRAAPGADPAAAANMPLYTPRKPPDP